MDKQQVYVDDILASFSSPIFIGGGGQKQVFSTCHSTYGTVAIKIGVCTSASAVERVSREVGLLRAVESPYFPQQFEFYWCEGSRYCIIEELIDGSPLDQHLADYTDSHDALSMLKHLVTAMSIFWQQRVVHRDLKPANIIVAHDHPRIIDLGIARIQDAQSLTMSCAPFGPCTPDYASLEQLTNQKHCLDHRSDQFTLGIVLGQLLLGGSHPFDPSLISSGNSIPENILSGVWHRAALRRSCAENIFVLLERMLGVQPYQRFRRYQDFSFAVNAALGGNQ